MRKFEVAEVVLGDSRLGWTVANTPRKVVEPHLYEKLAEAEAKRQAMEDEQLIRQHWPDARDPDVTALANSEDFLKDETNLEVSLHPVYRLHQAAEVIARKRAGL